MAIVALLAAASLGAGYAAGRGAPTVTTTVTTSHTPASSEIVGPTDGVDLIGCSISNDTCTFLITNVVQLGSSIGITLDKSDGCVTLTYGSDGSFSSDAASNCTSSPSYFISSTGGSATFTAIFPPFGGLEAPVVGQSVYGCIGYTTTIVNVTDFGCLAFLGAFTPSNTAVATFTVTETLTTQASQATTTYAIPTNCAGTTPTETTTTMITVRPTPPAYTVTVTVTTTATSYTQTVTVTSCTYITPTVTSTVTTTVNY